ncbi:hypothetical protein AN640_08010 [Candidatus Epulonipiscium fishelsonii]|uniref:Uncharacterized protein n=1 Tax=Candidatus Epulonipiscium fishelsonii TaxID=77094 RepID=A0ACC8XEE2_9FIRM|nr:hypothetical protein AN640_08010 [Epulopiscium sp. SCG-D08WGA-EpuloA1]
MRNIFIGMILGIANVIPGVSAGTMAVIFKIYDQLLDSISLDMEKLKKNFNFLAALGIGVVIGVVGFSSIITYLYENYSMQTSFAFIGVIVGSIPMIYKKVSQEGPVNFDGLILFVIPLFIMLYMSIQGDSGENTTIIRQLSTMSMVWLIFAGAISAFTMIIPGISGSFILLTIGAYTTIITAISERNVLILIPVGIGVVIGLVGGSKLVRILMEKYTQNTYLVILGLVVGSIFTLYPGFSLNKTGIISIICMTAAAIISYSFSEN